MCSRLLQDSVGLVLYMRKLLTNLQLLQWFMTQEQPA